MRSVGTREKGSLFGSKRTTVTRRVGDLVRKGVTKGCLEEGLVMSRRAHEEEVPPGRSGEAVS